MNLFYQFYFVTRKYFEEKAKYQPNSTNRDPSGSASFLVALLFSGWIITAYFVIIQIFHLEDIDKSYGKFICIIAFLIFAAGVYYYFDERQFVIYNKCLNEKIQNSKVLVFASLFFVAPFILIIFFNSQGWLSGIKGH